MLVFTIFKVLNHEDSRYDSLVDEELFAVASTLILTARQSTHASHIVEEIFYSQKTGPNLISSKIVPIG